LKCTEVTKVLETCITEFTKGYRPRTNLLSDLHNILNKQMEELLLSAIESM